MEKRCLIIMPISDPEGYAQGHFNRVFQYIVGPSCRMAGFRPVRADDPGSYDTVLDVIKNIVESEIAICDLSSKNSHALYVIAIRQALGLPVVLIKDLKTNMVAGIPGSGDVEYDESLRIDTVEKEIQNLSETLNSSFANKAETSSLLNRLGIGLAQLAETPAADLGGTETDNENDQKKEKPLPLITPVPDYVGDPITRHEEFDKLKVGDSLFHINYGKGEIKAFRKMGKDKMVDLRFESGSKLLVLMTSGIFRKVNA